MAQVTVYMPGGETWTSDGDAQAFTGEDMEILLVETKHRSYRFPMMNVLWWCIDKDSAHPSTEIRLTSQLHTVASGPDPTPWVDPETDCDADD